MIWPTLSPLAVHTFGTNFSFIVAILDGTAPIVTNVSSYPVVPTMAFVPNQWNANANLAGLDTFATNPFAAQDVMKPLDFVPNPMNVGAAWDGLDPIARPVCLTLDVKMDSASSLGSANVLETM